MALSAFTPQAMQAYIEDTDAYGILYNANYLQMYDRALQLHLKNKRDHDDERLPDFSIIRAFKHKFKSSPSLGAYFVIEGNPVHANGEENLINGSTQTWEMQMRSPEGDEVYNTLR